MIFLNHVGEHKTKKKNFYDEETDNFSSTSVTDNLFVHSALPSATKTHTKLNYKKK